MNETTLETTTGNTGPTRKGGTRASAAQPRGSDESVFMQVIDGFPASPEAHSP